MSVVDVIDSIGGRLSRSTADLGDGAACGEGARASSSGAAFSSDGGGAGSTSLGSSSASRFSRDQRATKLSGSLIDRSPARLCEEPEQRARRTGPAGILNSAYREAPGLTLSAGTSEVMLQIIAAAFDSMADEEH